MKIETNTSGTTTIDGVPPIIVFDGHCRLCLASLRFIEKHDRARRFRYLPFQGVAGRMVVDRLVMDPEVLDSFMLLYQGRALTKTVAWSRILRAGSSVVLAGTRVGLGTGRAGRSCLRFCRSKPLALVWETGRLPLAAAQ